MDMNLWFGLGVSFFTLYWVLLSKLVDFILEKPRLKRIHWLAVGMINTIIVFSFYAISGNIIVSYFMMMVLMLLEFTFFYKDSFSGALLCSLACFIHIISFFIIAVSIFSIVSTQLPFAILSDKKLVLLITTISFGLLNGAIFAVIKIIPLPIVKLINQHKEQKWFIIAWMMVNFLFLFYIAKTFFNRECPSYVSGNQIATSITSLVSLYIVLFFSIKISTILGYKEKNAELEQAIHKEQQFRNSIIKEAIASYEVNVTQDVIIKGFEDKFEELGNMIYRYNDMLTFMSQKIIYSEDIADFIKNNGRSNLLRLFENEETEVIVEYRRLLETGNYIWVRTIANLMKDFETGDVKAFVCVKNIDAEKKKQIELQRKAERDSLTGLYNKSMTTKLIDEHLIFNRSLASSALFMIDVDNFKEINDHLGHLYGDAVLCELAEKLQHIFRNNDIVGRVGGDEFIVFLRDGAVAQKAEEKAAEICKAFNITYQGPDGIKYSISSSVGVSLFPKDADCFKELYSYADVALYEAKADGKNNYKMYDGNTFTGYSSKRTTIQTIGNISQKGFRKNRIEYVFKILYESENPVSAIHSVLELVARHFSFERGYIFETSKDGKTTDNTFEWCAEGITAEITNLQKVPIETVATANESFQQTGTFILKSIEDLQPIERAVLEPQGIKSMFQFGIFDKSRLLGFIGFDNCRSEMVPSDTEVDEMKTICNILATFFVKQYIDEVSTKDLLARQEVMNQLNNYIYVINIETFEVLFMNDKVQKLVSESVTEGCACYDFFRGEKEQCADCPVRKLANSETDRVVCELHNDKLNIWMETAASFLRWTDGSLACLIICTDITSQKEAHVRYIKQLEMLACEDVLTGCRSYHKFKEDARCILEKQPDTLHLFIKLDIDNFNLVNQMYGFEKGDDILRCVAKAFKETMRNANEIFARVASDEYIALFEVEGKEESDMLFENFLTHFNTFVGNDFSFQCVFPHGRYLVSSDDAKTMDINGIFEKTNIAHKAAKLDKTMSFAYYDESMTKKALRAKEIENKMMAALKNEEFVIYLQPKYYLDNETIGGAEALTRWNNTNADLFFPATFIPIFEQNGFITKLDFYVFKKVCRTIKSWIDSGIEPVPVSVNFSRLHLGNNNFVKRLCEIVDKEGVDRKLLEIEITETVIYDNIDTLEILINEIHENGFSMSMDDFGSGYSSLGMLKSLPFDVIKMDRSFFVNQSDEKRSKTVVGSIIQMASKLGIRIVAEGVEDLEHITFLRDLQCDMVQGYYYAKPMPTEDFVKLLVERTEKNS